MDNGLIHVYCGDGKGKTTAAFGLALRAAGAGFNVMIVQFLKSGETGEVTALAKLPEVRILRSQKQFGFSFAMTDAQKHECEAVHTEMLRHGIAAAETGAVDLLILDEIIAAYNLNLVDREALLAFLRHKPESVEVVLTGREPAAELAELAHYISEIRKIKHPYDQGIKARPGIER